MINETLASPKTATQLAVLIRHCEVSIQDVVECYLRRIETYNDPLNAVVTLDADAARHRAQQADKALSEGHNWGPLHGIPITIKDSFDTKGLRTTAGYKPFSSRVPGEDALLVSRLRDAGAIILGKTNLPTLASGIQTDNAIFGRTNNPWNPAFTPGGSSGGSATAIAAGLSALELGSDIGGSIRIPAHFCGIYGLKMTGQGGLGKGHIASPSKIKLTPELSPLLELASSGPLARSVEDLQLAFSVLADWSMVRSPVERRTPLNIACTIDFGGAPISAETRNTMLNMVKRLQECGHNVDCAALPTLDFEDAWELAGECLACVNNLFQTPLVRWFRRWAGRIGGTRTNLHPIMRGLYRGVGLDSAGVAKALRRRQALIDQLEEFLDKWDAWICPVFPTPAFTHRSMSAPIEVDDCSLSQLVANLLYSILFNLSGHPAVVIPVGFTQANMPIGVQIIGKRFEESKLLKSAQIIDTVLNVYRCPPLTRKMQSAY